MIIIDSIVQQFTTGTTAISIPISIKSSDSFLVVCFGTDTNGSILGSGAIKFNGVGLTQVVGIVETQSTFNGDSEIWIMKNPPVGTYLLTTTNASQGGGGFLTAYILLGVDKKTVNIQSWSQKGSSTSTPTVQSLTVQPPSANSLVIDCISITTNNGASSSNTPNISQTQVMNWHDTTDGNSAGSSFKFLTNNTNTMSWTVSSNGLGDGYSFVAIALESAQAPSISYPIISTRNIFDVVNKNNLNTGAKSGTSVKNSYGYFPSTFFQNSFLHTVGRMLHPPTGPAIATRVNETERITSQILIDKVYQGNVGGGATLNLQINVPAQNSTLVVSGGSAIATGGAWVSVNFNGVSLTKLIAAATSNTDAEIWYMKNPPIGTHTLSIVPTATTGQVYANAMVILGLDMTNANFITASTTDAAATSTISASLQADASNVLIIDALATIDATAAPVPDQLQTPMYFPAGINANEYVVSTYKLATTGVQSMSHNLSVAVTAALVAVAFRPAKAASIWNPNIGTRNLNDVVTQNGLDAGTTPASGNYGYKPTVFYQNSFLHTIGRKGFSTGTSNHFLSLLGVGT